MIYIKPVRNNSNEKQFGKCLECGHVYDLDKFKCPECGKINPQYIFLASGMLSTICFAFGYAFFIFGLFFKGPKYGISYNFLKINEYYKVPYMILSAVSLITFYGGLTPLKKDKAFLDLQSKAFMVMDLIIVLAYTYIITHLPNVTIYWLMYCPIVFGLLMIPTQYFFTRNFASLKEMIARKDEDK